jgi:hypothetical protein
MGGNGMKQKLINAAGWVIFLFPLALALYHAFPLERAKPTLILLAISFAVGVAVLMWIHICLYMIGYKGKRPQPPQTEIKNHKMTSEPYYGSPTQSPHND